MINIYLRTILDVYQSLKVHLPFRDCLILLDLPHKDSSYVILFS